MEQGSYLYCDVGLPVPLDQAFTYSLPETLQHRVREGSRLLVPFGPRKLSGVILRPLRRSRLFPLFTTALARLSAAAARFGLYFGWPVFS